MNKILPIILLVAIGFVSYGVYTQANKSIKSKRLQCQSATTTFERIFVDEPIKESIKALKSNNYIIKSDIEYSKLMKSNLIDTLNIEQADEILEKTIKEFIKNETHKSSDKKVLIDYYIYENDKKDSGKKNDDAKKYAGYLVFQFKYDNKLVYKIQTDYMNIDGSDIKERMNCVFESFVSID